MAVVRKTLLLSAAATLAVAFPHSSTPPQSTPSKRDGGLGDTYTYYSGDGTTSQGWPGQDKWLDYESMWGANAGLIKSGCEGYSGVADNSDSEVSDLKSAIASVASESGVDERFILAVVIEESSGCVRVPTSNNGYQNPGFMQSFQGNGTCNDNGKVQNPCPASEITQQIKDGTEGTPTGNGLKQNLQEADASDVSQFYKAATYYNAGQIDSSGNLDAPQDANACYACDIANRLTGWVTASSDCDYSTGQQT